MLFSAPCCRRISRFRICYKGFSICCPYLSLGSLGHNAKGEYSIQEDVRESSSGSSLNSEEVPLKRPHPTNPMEVLSRIFSVNKRAVMQHHELISCLACGDEDASAEVAAILARTVKKELSARSVSRNVNSSTNGDLPTVGKDTLEEVTEKLASELRGNDQSGSDDASVGEMSNAKQPELWTSPDALRLVVIETLFETEEDAVEKGELLRSVVGSPPKSKDLAMEILDRYLSEEGDKWRAQKHQIASVVLHAAKSCGITPLDLHACETTMLHFRSRDELNPMKHVNLVIRGEVPSTLDSRNPERTELLEKEIERELESLKVQMSAQGYPLSPLEEKMALYELRRSKTVMRYSVGIHHDLQKAFDTSKTVKKIISFDSSSGVDKGMNTKNGSEFFVSHAIQMLNEPDEYNSFRKANSMRFKDDHDISLLETPVIPFTFMLKCCLWFDVSSK